VSLPLETALLKVYCASVTYFTGARWHQVYTCERCKLQAGYIQGGDLAFLNLHCKTALPLRQLTGQKTRRAGVCGKMRKLFRSKVHFEFAVSAMVAAGASAESQQVTITMHRNRQ
jgi:hypothetical protein